LHISFRWMLLGKLQPKIQREHVVLTRVRNEEGTKCWAPRAQQTTLVDGTSPIGLVLPNSLQVPTQFHLP
jgi:hypothetical protein